MNLEILKIIQEKGILLERDLFDLLGKFSDISQARSFLDTLQMASGQKVISTTSLSNHIAYVDQAVKNLSSEMQDIVQTTFIKLGLTLEVLQTTQLAPIEKKEETTRGGFGVFYSDTKNTKKIEVSDFVGHFRSRYQQIQRILLQRADSKDLVSINKISKDRQRFSFIGIVSEKRATGNKNLIIKFEDLTGSVNGLVRLGGDCFSKANELQLDDVVLVKASGNNEIVFVQDIIYPDSFKEKVRFDEDAYIGFVSDIHAGSAKHLGNEFQRFMGWLNNDKETASKIKYLFFVGDNVDGVGVFPGQERVLSTKSLKDQYNLLGSYLKQVPQNITMFMCPGQHDSSRVAEPQPIIDKFYGEALYSIPNLVLVSNPSYVKLFEDDKVFNVLMYHGASIHTFINEIEELRLLKAHKCPARAVCHMLKRRHLSPSHSYVNYIPNREKDPLVISEVPDVLCTGEVHRLDIEMYNGTLILTGSCWQSQTEFEEKVGNIPDPCKVPLFNLKTRELKIMDFNMEK